MATYSRSRTLARLFSVLMLLSMLLISSPPKAYAFDGLPNLPVNACNNSSLPRSFGTNFPTPNDPFSFGFFNTAALGWEGNWYAPFAYLSGSFFARGVPTTFTQGSTTFCGAMFSFGAYTFGLNSGQQPPAGSVQWTMDSGYLPALTTSFTRNNVAISITNFANKATINGNDFELVYSRVRMTNNGSGAVTIDPAPTGPNRAVLANPSNTLQPGQSSNHDYVVAVDSFGSGQALPSASTLLASAPNYDTAYSQMSAHWNNWLAGAPTLQLPNLTLPNTNNLSNPGTKLINAAKASFVYVRIFQVGKAPFSAANNYNWLLNHDVPGILANRFVQGDFTDAQNLLLVGRISEQPGFNEQGANWYWDGLWKTPWAWAVYLAKTNDTAFVSQFFHDDAGGSSPWGPSLFTMFHTHYLGQLNAQGYLKTSFDNDSTGTWLFDDYSALMGLAAYKYIATRIGNTTEATWADQQMTSLMNATNSAVAANQSANGFNYLPCEVNRPNSANRCNNATDANWGGNTLFGQNGWDAFLMGANPTGVLGNPAMIDNTYDFGYGRLQGVLPFPTTGAFNGYSTAYLTSYAQGGLFSNRYRDLAITAYAWQLATTTGGPNAWWEANGSGPNSNNPWAGSHAGPQFGACPYGWPLSGQALTLLDAIAAEGLAATPSGGSFTFTRPLYIGRGIPNTWIAAGQTIGASNLTSSFNVGTSARSTYGVSLSITKPGAQRIITVNLSGSLPGGPVLIQLPIFASVGAASVTGGSYNASTKTVTANAGATQVVITLDEGSTGTSLRTWYKFDETSGTTAADSAGTNNATLVNGPTFVAGRVGNAVNLDGTNDQVSMPAGIVNGLNDFTIAAWVKLDTTSAWRRLFDFGTGTTVNMFLTPQSGSSTVRFAITTGGGGAEQQINSTSALPTGVWKHVAVTLSGNVGTLYVDGVQVGQNTNMTLRPSSLGNTTNNWIGRSQYAADPFLDGQVDEFRIYNRALSAAEVLGLFQNP
jgi:hypothetical protein